MTVELILYVKEGLSPSESKSPNHSNTSMLLLQMDILKISMNILNTSRNFWKNIVNLGSTKS